MLGGTWTLLGEAPDWQKLYARREPYRIGVAPQGALFLIAGSDVQKTASRLKFQEKHWIEREQGRYGIARAAGAGAQRVTPARPRTRCASDL